MIEFERLLDEQGGHTLTQEFPPGHHEAGVNGAALLPLKKKFLGNVSQKSGEFIPSVNRHEVPLVLNAVVVEPEKGGIVEIRKGFLSVFLAPGKVGHPLQFFKITPERLYGKRVGFHIIL